MKKLWKAICNWFRGKSNRLAESINDVEMNAELGIEDARTELASNRTAIAELMASTSGLKRDVADAIADVAKCEKMADGFAEAGDTEKLGKVEGKLKLAEKKRDSLQTTVDANTVLVTKLREKNSQYETQIEGADNKLDILKAQNQSAKLQEKMVKSTSFSNEGLGALNALEDAVEKRADTADALEELSGSDNDLDKAFEALDTEESPRMKKAREAKEAKEKANSNK